MSSNIANTSTPKIGKFTLSFSVNKLLEHFNTMSKDVSAIDIVNYLIKTHPYYAEERLKGITFPDTVDHHPIIKWLKDVSELFNPSKISSNSNKTEEGPELHGRHIVFGLALLEPDFRKEIEQNDIFKILTKEIHDPIKDILTQKGKILYTQNNAVYDTVENQLDDPVKTSDGDMLRRYTFARYLALRIHSTDFEKGAYSIHLCGAWGSGKSTILNFLKNELEQNVQKGNNKNNLKWTVVEFNAWRNQHISPPWWPLYDKIHSDKNVSNHLSLWFKVKEKIWRLCSGQSFTLIATALIFWLIVIFLSFVKIDMKLSEYTTIADDFSKIIALITTAATGVLFFTRSLMFNSAKAAERFQSYAQDPINTIAARFKKLVKSTSSKTKIAVFIDDLDRCKSRYAISLLEGIQTIFRQEKVLFVVAADKKWLNACFEIEYQHFTQSVKEPGKSLGTLFLEKTFQLCAPMPGIHLDVKKNFWHQLIKVEDDTYKKNIKSARKRSAEIIKSNVNDKEIFDTVRKSISESIYDQVAIREAAVEHLATPSVVERTEHTLKPFFVFLDNNPRAMKRLVNAYSINLALALITFTEIDQEDLAQWTVLTMRWPMLADYLIKNPSKIGKIGSNKLGDIDESVIQLFQSGEVEIVVKGTGITNTPLTEDIIKKMVYLQ